MPKAGCFPLAAMPPPCTGYCCAGGASGADDAGLERAGVVVLALATWTARSVALAGFALDSPVEIGASTVVLWELSGTGEDRQWTHVDVDAAGRADSCRRPQPLGENKQRLPKPIKHEFLYFVHRRRWSCFWGGLAADGVLRERQVGFEGGEDEERQHGDDDAEQDQGLQGPGGRWAG